MGSYKGNFTSIYNSVVSARIAVCFIETTVLREEKRYIFPNTSK